MCRPIATRPTTLSCAFCRWSPQPRSARRAMRMPRGSPFLPMAGFSLLLTPQAALCRASASSTPRATTTTQRTASMIPVHAYCMAKSPRVTSMCAITHTHTHTHTHAHTRTHTHSFFCMRVCVNSSALKRQNMVGNWEKTKNPGVTSNAAYCHFNV